MKNMKDSTFGRMAWKRFGAFMLSAVLVGNGAAALCPAAVYAQEEEEQRITLNVVDDEDETSAEEESESEDAAEKEEETEAPETEEPETEAIVYDTIGSVDTGSAKVISTDVSQIVESCMPSIVSINEKSVQEVETYFYGTQSYETSGTASGVIVAQNDTELLIATNSHVVDGATEVSVCFTADVENPEDLVVPAKIKGSVTKNELAVVAVALKDIPEDVYSQLRIAKLGRSDDLKVGQAAIAIGNALGYGQSVTSGIISALKHDVVIDHFQGDLIQTDAAINLGNSGGALLNANGEVIGINLAKEVGTSTDNIGYAIPIDEAVPILERLVNRQTRDKMANSERGYLGVTVVDVSEDAMQLYDMPVGAFVYEVAEDSCAAQAGIKKGDIITRFDDVDISGKDELVEQMCYYHVGETVKVAVQSFADGKYTEHEVEVTLQDGGAAAEEAAKEEAAASEEDEDDAAPAPGQPEEDQMPGTLPDQDVYDQDFWDQFRDGGGSSNGNGEGYYDFFPFFR